MNNPINEPIFIKTDQPGSLTVCSCGQISKKQDWRVSTCPRCGLTLSLGYIAPQNKWRELGRVNSKIEIYKDNGALKVESPIQRIKPVVQKDPLEGLSVKEVLSKTVVYTITFDFAKKESYCTRSNSQKKLLVRRQVERFRPGLAREELKARLLSLYNEMNPYWRIEFSEKDYEWLNFTGLLRMMDKLTVYPQLSLLIKEGLPRKVWRVLNSDYVRWSSEYATIWTSGRRLGMNLDLEATRPSRILQLTDFQYRAVKRRKLGRGVIETIRQLNELIGIDLTNNLIRSGRRLNPELVPIIQDILYYEVDPVRLVRFISRERDILSTLIIIRDYLLMRRMNGQDTRTFPRNVLEEHDRLMRETRAKEDEFYSRLIPERAKMLEHLEDSFGPYTFEVPGSVDDFNKEGRAMHHCVASYYRTHAEGHTTVVFLRKEGKPHVTLEIRKGKIVQAKAIQNTAPEKEAREIIKKWAEKHGIRF